MSRYILQDFDAPSPVKITIKEIKAHITLKIRFEVPIYTPLNKTHT